MSSVISILPSSCVTQTSIYLNTDFETIFLFDFCVNIIRFFPKAYRKEISDGKSYRVTAPVRTTVPQLLLQQPVNTKKNIIFDVVCNKYSAELMRDTDIYLS
jgi:hypothetical protein